MLLVELSLDRYNTYEYVYLVVKSGGTCGVVGEVSHKDPLQQTEYQTLLVSACSKSEIRVFTNAATESEASLC
eukprot:scaffold4121_cov128-Skeletonema_dohrnii-CCMP3373.AAC.4